MATKLRTWYEAAHVSDKIKVSLELLTIFLRAKNDISDYFFFIGLLDKLSFCFTFYYLLIFPTPVVYPLLSYF